MPQPQEQEKKVSRRKVLQTSVALAVTAGLGFGVKDILSNLSNQGHPGDKLSPKPISTASKPPGAHETPTPGPDSQETLRSQKEVQKNIEVFFSNEFTREDLIKWGENNIFGAYFPNFKKNWNAPVLLNQTSFGVTRDGSYYIEYKNDNGSLAKTITPAAQLSSIIISEVTVNFKNYYIVTYLGLDLGVYKIKNSYISAVGFMPNPELQNGMSDKYIQFFDVAAEFVGQKTSPFTHVKKDPPGTVYTYMGNSASSFTNLDVARTVEEINRNTGKAIFVQSQSKFLYDLYSLGLLGKTRELAGSFQRASNDNLIHTSSGLELPSKAPAGGFGDIIGAPPLIPSLSRQHVS